MTQITRLAARAHLVLERAAYAFDRLHAHLFDAPWQRERTRQRTC